MLRSGATPMWRASEGVGGASNNASDPGDGAFWRENGIGRLENSLVTPDEMFARFEGDPAEMLHRRSWSFLHTNTRAAVWHAS